MSQLTLTLVLLLSALLIGAAPAGCAPVKDFVIGYWCGPPADTDPVEKYKEVAEANFNTCFPPCSGVTVEQNQEILEVCEQLGLKFILPDGRITSKKADDADFDATLDAVVNDYSRYPALGGYFIVDEPSAPAFPWLGAIVGRLREKDPSRLGYINLLPTYANEGQLGAKTYEEHVDRFCTTVKPGLLSYDHYALMTDGSLRGDYFTNLEIIRSQGLKHNVPTCFILQTLPHGPYRNPTEAEMWWQVNTGLVYGVKGIMYFTYWTPPADPNWNWSHAVITREGKRTEHYSQVKHINAALKTLGPALMKLTSTGVYHTGDLPEGTSSQKAGAPIAISSASPAVLGTFKHEDGSKWAMVMNRDMASAATVVLKPGRGVKSVEQMSPHTGQMARLFSEGGRLALTLDAGRAALLRLNE